MDELIAFIEAKNAETEAWIAEDPANRWACASSTNPESWKVRGIFTLEDYKRNELETMIYEGHKDAYGSKGRHYDFASMSMEELEAEADRIGAAITAELERERAINLAAANDFKNRIAGIQDLMSTDKENALRILIDAEGETENVSFYGYESLENALNLEYGFVKEWLEGHHD